MLPLKLGLRGDAHGQEFVMDCHSVSFTRVEIKLKDEIVLDVQLDGLRAHCNGSVDWVLILR